MADPVKSKLLPVWAGRSVGTRKRFIRYVEVGEGKIDPDGTPHFYVDRGAYGFTGHLIMPLDGKPPEWKPMRPGDPEDDEPQD